MHVQTTDTAQPATTRRQWGTGSWSPVLVAVGFTVGAVSFNGFTIAEHLTRSNPIPTGLVSMACLAILIYGWVLGRKYRHVHRCAALGHRLGIALAVLFAALFVIALIAP